MRIHKSDVKAIAPLGCKTWKEIMGIVEERAIHREGIAAERDAWRHIQNNAQESWAGQ